MSSVPSDMKMPFSKTLHYGLRGAEVERLQDWLNEMNEYYNFCKSVKSVKLSGFFDFDTVIMVVAFQGFWGYHQNGIYDLQTHDLMEWKFYNYMTNTKIAWQRAQEEEKRKQEEAANRIKKPVLQVKKAKDPFATRHW
jgi:hypothetical protein